MSSTLVQDLFKNQVHIGHKSEKWNPKMKPYIYGNRDKVHIIDLEKSAVLLEVAMKFLSDAKKKNHKVLFVGIKPQVALEIQKQVIPTGHFFVDQKWIPGLLTNFSEVRKRIDHYLNLKAQFENGEINKYKKKEVAQFKKDLDKLDASFRGVAEMRKRPEVVVVMDAVTNRLAIQEANKNHITVLAVADANADPDGIDYIVPGNDDSIRSIRFLLEKFLEALK